MYTVDSQVRDQEFAGLKVIKVVESSCYEILSISLEAGKFFPDHRSHKDAVLLVVEGSLRFFIEKEVYTLRAQQLISFPAGVVHKVEALNDTKFIIIR